MKYIKTFENYENVTLTPKEFADKYNSDYEFIVYVNGKAESGWESLYDTFMNGVKDILDIFDEDEFEYEDNIDMKLGENNISISDEVDDIDENDLNDSLGELIGIYDVVDDIEIRLVH